MPYNHEQTSPHEGRLLEVDCSWRKNTVLISNPDDSAPLYLAKTNPWNMKTVFEAGSAGAKIVTSDSDTDSVSPTFESGGVIGNSKVKVFNIDCEMHIRGRPVRLSAAKKLLTRYNFPSLAYAENSLKPAVMTWKCGSMVKAFDFDLFDEKEELVAQFKPRYLGVRKLASFKLFGEKAWDIQATEEVVITGLTLYLCMVYRASSPVPLVGALVSRPGKDYKVTEQETKEEYERNMAMKSNGLPQLEDSTVNPKQEESKMAERATQGEYTR